MTGYHRLLDKARFELQQQLRQHGIELGGQEPVEAILLRNGFAIGHRFVCEQAVADLEAKSGILEIKISGRSVYRETLQIDDTPLQPARAA